MVFDIYKADGFCKGETMLNAKILLRRIEKRYGKKIDLNSFYRFCYFHGLNDTEARDFIILSERYGLIELQPHSYIRIVERRFAK